MFTDALPAFWADWVLAGKAASMVECHLSLLLLLAEIHVSPDLAAVRVWVGDAATVSMRRKRAQAIRAFDRWPESIGDNDFSWWRNLPVPAEAEKPQPTATAASCEAGLGVLGPARDRVVLSVLLGYELRRSEVAHLVVRDMSVGNGVLVVRFSKTGKPRVVPMPPVAVRWVRRHLRLLRFGVNPLLLLRPNARATILRPRPASVGHGSHFGAVLNLDCSTWAAKGVPSENGQSGMSLGGPNYGPGGSLMKVNEAIANALKECGAGHLFGLMGDGNLRFINYWVHDLEMPYFGSRHESAAIAMADGFTRISDTFAVATTTQGPGLTNALTALIAARKSHTPLLFVVGDVSSHQEGWPQDIDHSALFDAAGVPLVGINDVDRAFSDTVNAVRTAIYNRTPIGINMPVDFQERDWVPWNDDTDTAIEQRSLDFTGDLEAAASALAGAKRPAIIAGRGAVEAGCETQLQELGDRIGALYATTLKGKGLFQDHPFTLGICGSLGTNLTATTIGQADVVLIVGAGMNDFTTVRQTLLRPNAQVVRCDIDSELSTANIGKEHVLTGNAAGSVAALLDRLTELDVASTGFRTPERAQELSTFRPESEIVFAGEPDLIDPRELVIMLNDVLPAQRNVVTDAGRFFGDPCSYMTIPDANAFVDGISFGSIGLGLGLSMGVAAARPERPTVVFIGDGGLFMSLGELETAVRHSVPLLIVVMNDSAYGSELQISRVWELPDDLSVFPEGDFAAIAEGIGARSASARSLDQVRAALEGVDLMDGPYLIDCTINPDITARWLDDAFERD